MQPHTTALDRAIVAYRENPSPENRARVLAEQKAHTTAFYARLANEYVARSSERGKP